MTLSDFLSEMGEEDKPLKYSAMLQVSGLTADELVLFKDAWESVTPPRKNAVMGILVELCEDNPELDFSDVFRAGLEDADANVRLRSTQGLWDCDDRAIIRPLLGMLVDDPSPEVRAAAGTALGNFAALAREGKLLSGDEERIRDALLSVVGRGGEDVGVRRRALEAVAHLDFPERNELIGEAYASGDPTLKQGAIHAMGRSSSEIWMPAVLQEMKNESSAIRYEAAVAAGMLGDESTVPHLVRLVDDDDAEAQLAAVEALGEIGGRAAKAALQRCLEMDDELLEEAARSALENIEFDDDPLGFTLLG